MHFYVVSAKDIASGRSSNVRKSGVSAGRDLTVHHKRT